MNVAVIGSGVAGISVAHALVERGVYVTILDVGETLDARRRAVVDKLKHLSVSQRPTADHELLRSNPTFGRGELPKKMHFGSPYIYAQDRSFAPLRQSPPGRAPLPTFAMGGFSNIWGACVLAPDQCDMVDWPVTHAEMERYFRKAGELMPLCGGEGTLARSFPAFASDLGSVDPGPQGEALLEDLRDAEPELSKRKTLYGKARLAIHTRDSEVALACNGCGECFTGCVRDAIFGTVPLLENLTRQGRVAYRAGFFAESVRDRDGRARVDGVDVSNSGGSPQRVALEFDSIFIAAGPIETSRMLLRSAGLYNVPVQLKESQKFVIPILRWRAAATAIEHPSITLASVFLETKVESLSDHWLHVQIVPMHGLIAQGSGVPGLDHAAIRLAASPLLRRLMFAWCGLHSDHSSQVQLCLRAGEAKAADTLEMELRVSPRARADARQAARALFHLGFHFSSLFCYWFTRFSNPGSGTHCGSSFPMCRVPAERFDSDIFGRPFGWKRIYAVDASILPSIPGTTLAFPVMANAIRIGSLAPM